MSSHLDPEVPTDQAPVTEPGELFETLSINHELLIALRDNAVLGTFLLLPKVDQANFIRWLGAIDSKELRNGRTETFIVALQQSPLADSAHHLDDLP